MHRVLHVVNDWPVTFLNISSYMHHKINDSKVLIKPVLILKLLCAAARETIYNIEWLCENARIVKRMCMLLENVEAHKLIN